MPDLAATFDWFGQPVDRRDAAHRKEIPQQLVTLWEEVRQRVRPERFDPVLGEVRAGRFTAGDETAWAQTNAERDSSFVNLTLEIDADELSLNLIGWFDPQLEKVESWLRKPKTWRFLREHPDWSLLIFVRRGNIGSNGKTVFQGAPGTEIERIDLSTASPVDISIWLTGLRPRLDPDKEKLSLHIRRSWTASEVSASDIVSDAVAGQVEAWLQPIQDIRIA